MKKGVIFNAYCHNFGEIIEVKTIEDSCKNQGCIAIEFVKGGHISVASKDNIWDEWETFI